MDYSFLNGKTLLVTGATGMIGSELIKEVLRYDSNNQNDISIIALYRNKEKKDRVFAEWLQDPRITFVMNDIVQPVCIDGPIDYIIHTAGVTGGSKQHVDYPMRTIATAIDGTRNMLELAREKRASGFVFLSTLEIYGATDPALTFISETDSGKVDPVAVRSSYPESKRLCETMCAAYAKQYNVPSKVVRLVPTYGAGADYSDKRVLCEFAKCVIEKKDIVLKSSGDTIRNYCDVADAVKAILLVMSKGQNGEAYNIANMQTEISIKELAVRFIQLYPEANIMLRFDIPKDITSLGYNKTVKIRLDSTKLAELGWKPEYGIDEIIKHLVGALQKNGK